MSSDERTTDPAHRAAPAYYQCPVCGFLSSDPAFASGDAACPLCGATGGFRRSFPTDRLRRLDERIRGYCRDGESEIVVILVAAFLEAILEDILDRILTSHGADVTVRTVVFDGQRAVGARIGYLFPHLTGEEFEDVATEVGYAGFPKRWRALRTARNAFIHDAPFGEPRESLDPAIADEGMELLDQAYELFVLVNNKFVAGERRAG